MIRLLLSALSIVCWLAVAFFALVMAYGIRETTRYPDAPQRVTLKDAIDIAEGPNTAWVWLTDVSPDCTRLVPVFRPGGEFTRTRNVTLAVMRDASGTEVVIEALGKRACNDIRSDDRFGVLQPLREGVRRDYQKEGLPLEVAKTRWVLCGQCGPSHSQGGLVAGSVGMVLLILLALKVHGWKKRFDP